MPLNCSQTTHRKVELQRSFKLLYEYEIKRLRPLMVSDHPGIVDDVKKTVADLNECGSDGWELVSVVPAGEEWLAFLKRPVR